MLSILIFIIIPAIIDTVSIIVEYLNTGIINNEKLFGAIIYLILILLARFLGNKLVKRKVLSIIIFAIVPICFFVYKSFVYDVWFTKYLTDWFSLLKEHFNF